MLRLLLMLQFPLLLLPTLMIGMVTYGTDLKNTYIGLCYLAIFVSLVPLAKFLELIHETITNTVFFVLITGTIVALLLFYRPLHLGHWNEHSLVQALLAYVISLASFAIAIIAARTHQPTSGQQHLVAGILLSSGWLLSLFYPLAGFLIVATILTSVLIGQMWRPQDYIEKDDLPQDDITQDYLQPNSPSGVRRKNSDINNVTNRLSGLLVTLIALEIAVAAFDYGTDTSLAIYFAILTLAFSAGYGLRNSLRRQHVLLAYLLPAVVACYLLPYPYVALLHPIMMGIALGWIWFDLTSFDPASAGERRAAVTFFFWYWILGWIMGVWFAGNLAYLNVTLVLWGLYTIAVIRAKYIKPSHHGNKTNSFTET